MRISFIGAGRVGAALAPSLHRAGQPVVAVHARNAAAAEAVAHAIPGLRVCATAQQAVDAADLVFLTVSDDAIAEVCRSILWREGMSVVHCSGATELRALEAARLAGAAVGAFHPLHMFKAPELSLRTLPGCTITIDAAPPLDATLESIGRALQCRVVRLPGGRRALYHASAYYVGPFVVALMREASQMWQALGLTERDALLALAPLLKETVAAAVENGLAQATGGCVTRGDVGTVRGHVAAIEDYSPEAAALYRDLARRTIPLAQELGTLSAQGADRIHAALEDPQAQ